MWDGCGKGLLRLPEARVRSSAGPASVDISAGPVGWGGLGLILPPLLEGSVSLGSVTYVSSTVNQDWVPSLEGACEDVRAQWGVLQARSIYTQSLVILPITPSSQLFTCSFRRLSASPQVSRWHAFACQAATQIPGADDQRPCTINS